MTTHEQNAVNAEDIAGKGDARLAGSVNETEATTLLGRKSVLLGMAASMGVVFANTGQPSAIAATQPAYAPKWTPSTAYEFGQQVISPKNDVVSANVAHTSSTAYATDGVKWSLSSTDVQGVNLPNQIATKPARNVTLVGCQDDETVAPYYSVITDDVVNFSIGLKGKQAVTSRVSNTFGFKFDYTTPLTFPTTTAAFGVRVFIPDVTQVTFIYLYIFNDGAYTYALAWRRDSSTIAKPLVNGWNTLRWRAAEDTRSANWGQITRVQVMGNATSASATFTVGQVWAECPAKASLMVIYDGPYQEACTTAYALLKARGIPVTLAIDPPYIGQFGGGKQRATQAQIDAVLADDISSGSIHLGTNGGTTGTMTAAQIRADVMLGIKYCEQNGYTGGMWRAAWLGNKAPQATAAKNLLLGAAVYNPAISGPSVWPPVDRHNIPRWAYDSSKTNADLDAQFTQLRDSHQMLLLYVHNVITPLADVYDTSVAQWDYLMTKVDEGLSGGWLEGVTFEQMWARGGGQFRPGAHGGQIAEFTDESGTLVQQRLP